MPAPAWCPGVSAAGLSRAGCMGAGHADPGMLRMFMDPRPCLPCAFAAENGAGQVKVSTSVFEKLEGLTCDLSMFPGVHFFRIEVRQMCKRVGEGGACSVVGKREFGHLWRRGARHRHGHHRGAPPRAPPTPHVPTPGPAPGLLPLCTGHHPTLAAGQGHRCPDRERHPGHDCVRGPGRWRAGRCVAGPRRRCWPGAGTETARSCTARGRGEGGFRCGRAEAASPPRAETAVAEPRAGGACGSSGRSPPPPPAPAGHKERYAGTEFGGKDHLLVQKTRLDIVTSRCGGEFEGDGGDAGAVV